MKTKTLKKEIGAIVKEVFSDLNKVNQAVDYGPWDAEVEQRVADELDLNDYRKEFIVASRKDFINKHTKDFPPLSEMLQMDFDMGVLDEGGFSVNGAFVTLGKANGEQMTVRWHQQFDHAAATMKTATNTKELLDSEVGKMVLADPKLSWKEALQRWLKK